MGNNYTYSCVYVLTDNDKLKYYNQMMISISSLRRMRFTGNIFVVVDSKTADLLRSKSKEIENFNIQILTVNVPDVYSPKEKSRFIKTSLREYIEGDYLFIDTDTVVANEFPETVSDAEIAMVIDSHGPMIKCGNAGYYRKLYEKCGYTFDETIAMYNSGVIWCKDTAFTHTFYRNWHNEWQHTLKCGVILDQPSLSRLNYEYGNVITELDERFNVQISVTFPLEYLIEAFIIHYWNITNGESSYILQQSEFRDVDYRSEVIQNVIKSPRGAFVPCRLVKIDGVEDRLTKTNSYKLLLSVFKNRAALFDALDLTVCNIQKMRKALHNIGRSRKSV